MGRTGAVVITEVAPVVALVALVEMAAGTAVIAWLVETIASVGRGFRGTTALICAAMMLLALLLLLGMGNDAARAIGVSTSGLAALDHWSIAFTVMLLVDALFAVVGTDAARTVVGAATGLVGLAAVGSGALLVTGGSVSDAVLGFGPATVLLGAAIAGMLLGHWYLIAPDLTFRPLRIAVYVVFGAVALQIGGIGLALLGAAASPRAALVGAAFGVPFWLLVCGSGIVFTAAVNGLTLYFARIRANQPATAMLYVLIISVLIGIIPAHLLYLETGIPV